MSDTRDLILTCMGASMGIGALCAVAAASFDFPCLPGYAETGLDQNLPKGTAMMTAARFALSNPLSVLPSFLGFSLVFLAAMLAPLAAPEKSHRRLMIGFALLPLILGTVIWIAVTGPGSDCTSNSVSLRILSGVAIGGLGLYGAAWLWGRLKDGY